VPKEVDIRHVVGTFEHSEDLPSVDYCATFVVLLVYPICCIIRL
jgi:hypothetical protein